MRRSSTFPCTASKQLIRGPPTKGEHEDIVTNSLLTVPNIHNTGKLPGILLLHIGMIVRLSDVLAPGLGLPKDKLGKVLRVKLHEQDQKRVDALPAGYQLFVPEFMAKGFDLR